MDCLSVYNIHFPEGLYPFISFDCIEKTMGIVLFIYIHFHVPNIYSFNWYYTFLCPMRHYICYFLYTIQSSTVQSLHHINNVSVCVNPSVCVCVCTPSVYLCRCATTVQTLWRPGEIWMARLVWRTACSSASTSSARRITSRTVRERCRASAHTSHGALWVLLR